MTLQHLVQARFAVGALCLLLAGVSGAMVLTGEWAVAPGATAIGLALMATAFAFPWSKEERGENPKPRS